jgi:hypothetical protein
MGWRVSTCAAGMWRRPCPFRHARRDRLKRFVDRNGHMDLVVIAAQWPGSLSFCFVTALKHMRLGRVIFVVWGISQGISLSNLKGNHMKKKIVATLLLAGLVAGAVMAESKLPSGKAVNTFAAAAAPTTPKKHKKHRKHRGHATKAAPANHKK